MGVIRLLGFDWDWVAIARVGWRVLGLDWTRDTRWGLEMRRRIESVGLTMLH